MAADPLRQAPAAFNRWMTALYLHGTKTLPRIKADERRIRRRLKMNYPVGRERRGGR